MGSGKTYESKNKQKQKQNRMRKGNLTSEVTKIGMIIIKGQENVTKRNMGPEKI